MDSSLRFFIGQYLGVVAAALAPVILIAFLSIPYTLGGHPGDTRVLAEMPSPHMT
ncbi:MAG: hypothetical protein ACOYNZ_08015 [Rhodoferax sp.]